jgi:hypothetical protein
MPGADTLEQLPFRVDGPLASALGISAGHLEVRPRGSQDLPALRCVLPRPVRGPLSLVVRVHSKAGIPLAAAPVAIADGDSGFETTSLAMLAMEGYAHLDARERSAVEQRVWSRRAFATGADI